MLQNILLVINNRTFSCTWFVKFNAINFRNCGFFVCSGHCCGTGLHTRAAGFSTFYLLHTVTSFPLPTWRSFSSLWKWLTAFRTGLLTVSSTARLSLRHRASPIHISSLALHISVFSYFDDVRNLISHAYPINCSFTYS